MVDAAGAELVAVLDVERLAAWKRPALPAARAMENARRLRDGGGVD